MPPTVANHPNRSRASPGSASNPPPPIIRQARESLGLTESAAAQVIYSTAKTWTDWETGVKRMHPQIWEAWCFKTGYRGQGASLVLWDYA